MRVEIKTEFGKVNSLISNAYFNRWIYFLNQSVVFNAYEADTQPSLSIWSAGFRSNFSVFQKKDATVTMSSL